LENIVIDGDRHGSFANGGNSLIRVFPGGTLIMNDGAVVRNNAISGMGAGIIVFDGNNQGSATFIMNGGMISGNVTSGNNQSGGGVSVGSRSTFTMNGGEISGNTAASGTGGGVRAGGTFTMTGGKISGNISNRDGAGVYASGFADGDEFTMTAGEISNNTSNRSGGGVFAFTTFTMNGGKIINNTAEDEGGGVYIASRPFTMNNGEISGNTAKEGGGVYAASAIFTMNGGEISDNTASIGGAGVYAMFSNFIMDGGEISGNTAGDYGTPGLGGGVHTVGQFILNSGKIINNTAIGPVDVDYNGGLSYGGGVYVSGLYTGHASYLFAMMNGGEISGNIGFFGKNVYVHDGTFVVVTGATGIVTDDLYEYDAAAVSEAPIVVKWNKPSGEGPFEYAEGTSTDLTAEPTGATAIWGIDPASWGTEFGIIFERATSDTTNTGFIEMDVLLSGPVTISIRDAKNTGRKMWFVTNPVKDVAEIRVVEGTVTRVVVYDAIGNIVHDGIEPIWDLTNTAGRFVANGTYLVVVETKNRDGKISRYSAKLGVKR
jgi:hypothetical protein